METQRHRVRDWKTERHVGAGRQKDRSDAAIIVRGCEVDGAVFVSAGALVFRSAGSATKLASDRRLNSRYHGWGVHNNMNFSFQSVAFLPSRAFLFCLA